MKIYALSGFSGTYDTYIEWIVAIYTTREQAELHENKLNEIIKNVNIGKSNAYEIYTIEKKIKELRYDININIQYNGIEYEIKEMDLYQHLDEYLESK